MGSVGDRRIKSTSNLFPVTMKGLLFVLLMLGLLLFTAPPETHGQPVPDTEDNYMSVDSAPEGSASGTSSTEDDAEEGTTTSVPDSATEESSTSQDDDGVAGTSITSGIGKLCPKNCRIKSIRDRRCVRKFNIRIEC